MLVDDLLGFGINDNRSLNGTMLEFLHILLAQPQDHLNTRLF